MHAFVLMPDHFHVILTPAPDVSLEKAMQFLKGGFSFRLKSRLEVWQRGYRETRVATSEQWTHFKRYVEENPVRAGLVVEAELFPFSSASSRDVDPPPQWLLEGIRG